MISCITLFSGLVLNQHFVFLRGTIWMKRTIKHCERNKHVLSFSTKSKWTWSKEKRLEVSHHTFLMSSLTSCIWFWRRPDSVLTVSTSLKTLNNTNWNSSWELLLTQFSIFERITISHYWLIQMTIYIFPVSISIDITDRKLNISKAQYSTS